MDVEKTDIVQFDSKENRRGTSFRASLNKRRPSRTGIGKSEKEKTNKMTQTTQMTATTTKSWGKVRNE